MLLTDRFLRSHRLEWLCLFLGCGLGQWLVLNARCLTAGYTHILQDAGVARRGRCSLNGTIGVFSLDPGQFNDLPFDPIEISCSFYDEQAIWSLAGVELW